MLEKKDGSITPEAIGETQLLDLQLNVQEYEARLTIERAAQIVSIKDTNVAISILATHKTNLAYQISILSEQVHKNVSDLNCSEILELCISESRSLVQRYEEQAHRLAGVQNAAQEKLSGIEKAFKQHRADRNPSCSLCHYHETDQLSHTQIIQKRGDGAIDVKRYRIESDTAQNLVGTYIGSKNLHPVEEQLFKQAFEDLAIRPSAETFIKLEENERLKAPNNIVLVDIFVRDNNGNIKKDQDSNAPETHTVALWKKKDGEIVLIDPSNTEFSSQLQSELAAISKQEINTTSVNKGKIYKPARDLGRGVNDSRDCVDIAVKIGLELNALQKEGVAVTEIENKMLGHMSNQPDALSKIHSAVSKNPKDFEKALKALADTRVIRGAQSSDLLVRRRSTGEIINKIRAK